MNKITIVLIILLILLCCCIGLLCSGIFWVLSGQDLPDTLSWNSSTTEEMDLPVTSTGTMAASGRTVTPRSTSTPIPTSTQILLTATPEFISQPASDMAIEVLQTLEAAEVPMNDLRDLAMRLEGKSDNPLTIEGSPHEYQIGDEESFWVSNTDSDEKFQVHTILVYTTPHTYFWIEEGVDYDLNDVEELMNTFEDQIYPINREFFGSEWTPGVDNDPHLYVVYAGNLGYYLGGYFSSIDSYLPEVHEYPNAHEMLVLSSDNVWLDDEYTYGILAHEFQHMIHWNLDRNESIWINEGFAELAVFLNGYDTGYKDYSYASSPDMNITTWSSELGDATPNYGSAFLFMTYFLDRFGEEVTKALVAEQENNMYGLDKVFSDLVVTDPSTDEIYTADEFFRDWTLANFINDVSVEDGRYYYGNYDAVAYFSETETINNCTTDWLSRDVNQYGVDYIGVNCDRAFTLHFSGESEVGILPADVHSGDYVFWSNKGDESDMTLTRSFDFTGISAPISLTYWTWFDLEENYDYLYLEISEDGENWEIINTPSCTFLDPSGNNYGCGYNGTSGGWVEEMVDLSDYAGKEIQVRFEYVTDGAVNGEGLMLDDISVAEVNYSSDFEADDGEWEAAGFVRIQNRLPQTYLVSIIQRGNDTHVIEVDLEDDQTAELQIEPQSGDTDTIIVISGTTRYTNELARYRIKLGEQ